MSIVGLLIAGLVPTPTQLFAFFEQMSEGLLMGQSILCAFFRLKIFLNQEKFNTSLHAIHVEMIKRIISKPEVADAFSVLDRDRIRRSDTSPDSTTSVGVCS